MMKEEGIPLGMCVTPRTEKATPVDFPDEIFLGLDDIEAHTTRLLGTKPCTSMKSAAKRFYPGDVLYSRLRPYLNKVWLADRTGLCSSEFIVVPSNDHFDGAFLKYRINAMDFVSFANSLNAGDRPRVDFEQISSFCLPPFSLARQRRIVVKIEELFSELDAGEQSLRVARRQLGVYRQSLLKQAFEGKLTEKWRTANPDKFESSAQHLARIQSARQARYAEQLKAWTARDESDKSPKQAKPRAPLPPTPLDREVLTELPQLPNGWAWAKMEDACDVVRGGSPRPAGDPKYYDGDIPFLKVADLTRVEGPYVDNYTSTIKPAGLQKTRYVEPPVLLISNSGATLGVPRICRIAATFNDGVAAFLDLDSESHRFFYYFWTSKTEALRNIDQGAAQPNLNTDLLKTYPVPLCSLPEQHEIVRLLDEQFEVIERNEREIDAALRRSEALRQAILIKAFTGQLVPQDPADEPASVLLARLRAQKQPKPMRQSKKNA